MEDAAADSVPPADATATVDAEAEAANGKQPPPKAAAPAQTDAVAAAKAASAARQEAAKLAAAKAKAKADEEAAAAAKAKAAKRAKLKATRDAKEAKAAEEQARSEAELRAQAGPSTVSSKLSPAKPHSGGRGRGRPAANSGAPPPPLTPLTEPILPPALALSPAVQSACLVAWQFAHCFLPPDGATSALAAAADAAIGGTVSRTSPESKGHHQSLRAASHGARAAAALLRATSFFAF